MIQIAALILGITVVGYAGLRLSCMVVDWYERKLAEGFQRVSNASVPIESKEEVV